ncbi:DUF2750 domain-containing protein [Mycobacterium paragordonae]|uniref:DUF2750 domain-containing protein n=1 Tax=Mycobacterium paragordonae TaxID=1389713 RepID=UPI0007EF7211|nr:MULTISPECIES: DUF2750 domain-containing protein [Mycobacterium]AYE94907.1 DUF2750 domain-containing protein [Mycobacterium paragordonae]OBK59436.1 hypothetical protein A5656_14505 [Mycobacterium gordonae]PJE24449.1 MAG: DUF2750 domain-containing protein [Mycobacterium sp.]
MALHLNAELDARYQRFLARVRAEGKVWLLIDQDMQGAWVESNHYEGADGEPVVVHLVYSAAAYARLHANGPWADRTPAALDLDEFLSGPLRHMHENGDLMGPDFNADLAGVEIEPLDLGLALLGEAAS